MISTLSILLLCVFVAVYVWWRFLFFFRDPERDAPTGNNIVSPADGRIVYVKRITNERVPMAIKRGKPTHLSELVKVHSEHFPSGHLVGIFMYPTSVHVQRSPIQGEVQAVINCPGRNSYMSRMALNNIFGVKPYELDCKYILENERSTTLIVGDFPVLVVQIGDTLVRKIVSYVGVGAKLTKGQRIGMVKMGSQVDLVIPDIHDLKMRVRVGEYVYAGKSVIAEYT